MFEIQVNNFEKIDLIRELVDEFLSPREYEITRGVNAENQERIVISVNRNGANDLNQIKRDLYIALSDYTKHSPDWGILTGVRPVKLAGELINRNGREGAKGSLLKDYLLSNEKTNLILDMYERQFDVFGNPDKKSVSLYIGIPFCPTRCSYCSFASNQEDYSGIKKYLVALDKEMDFVSKEMDKKSLYPETIYIGGGTPSILSNEDIESLLKSIKDRFNLAGTVEFSFEAGRPDTIDYKKLRTIKNLGVNRISINPQSMKAKTMELIGRAHNPEDIVRAYNDAREVGFNAINMDVIAGLPGESILDFIKSLNKIWKMSPENITVHSLAIKRASRLIEEDPELYRKNSFAVRRMVKAAFDNLTSRNYAPYYLYRQKHMSGACENIGYATKGKEGLYNIRIMDEHQTNIALGAGGISKVYFPEENRLERVANVTNYKEYINRIDEMIERKREGVFNAY